MSDVDGAPSAVHAQQYVDDLRRFLEATRVIVVGRREGAWRAVSLLVRCVLWDSELAAELLGDAVAEGSELLLAAPPSPRGDAGDAETQILALWHEPPPADPDAAACAAVRALWKERGWGSASAIETATTAARDAHVVARYATGGAPPPSWMRIPSVSLSKLQARAGAQAPPALPVAPEPQEAPLLLEAPPAAVKEEDEALAWGAAPQAELLAACARAAAACGRGLKEAVDASSQPASPSSSASESGGEPWEAEGRVHAAAEVQSRRSIALLVREGDSGGEACGAATNALEGPSLASAAWARDLTAGLGRLQCAALQDTALAAPPAAAPGGAPGGAAGPPAAAAVGDSVPRGSDSADGGASRDCAAAVAGDEVCYWSDGDAGCGGGWGAAEVDDPGDGIAFALGEADEATPVPSEFGSEDEDCMFCAMGCGGDSLEAPQSGAALLRGATVSASAAAFAVALAGGGADAATVEPAGGGAQPALAKSLGQGLEATAPDVAAPAADACPPTGAAAAAAGAPAGAPGAGAPPAPPPPAPGAGAAQRSARTEGKEPPDEATAERRAKAGLRRDAREWGRRSATPHAHCERCPTCASAFDYIEPLVAGFDHPFEPGGVAEAALLAARFLGGVEVNNRITAVVCNEKGACYLQGQSGKLDAVEAVPFSRAIVPGYPGGMQSLLDAINLAQQAASPGAPDFNGLVFSKTKARCQPQAAHADQVPDGSDLSEPALLALGRAAEMATFTACVHHLLSDDGKIKLRHRQADSSCRGLEEAVCELVTRHLGIHAQFVGSQDGWHHFALGNGEGWRTIVTARTFKAGAVENLLELRSRVPTYFGRWITAAEVTDALLAAAAVNAAKPAAGPSAPAAAKAAAKPARARAAAGPKQPIKAVVGMQADARLGIAPHVAAAHKLLDAGAAAVYLRTDGGVEELAPGAPMHEPRAVYGPLGHAPGDLVRALYGYRSRGTLALADRAARVRLLTALSSPPDSGQQLSGVGHQRRAAQRPYQRADEGQWPGRRRRAARDCARCATHMGLLGHVPVGNVAGDGALRGCRRLARCAAHVRRRRDGHRRPRRAAC